MGNSVSLSWNSTAQLLPLFVDFYKAKKANEDIDLNEAVGKVAGVLGIDDPEAAVEAFVQDQLGYALSSKDAEKIAGIVASVYEPVLQLAGDFVKGGMKPDLLLNGVNDIYIGKLKGLEGVFEETIGHELSDGAKVLFGKYALLIIAVCCFAAAYKIYCKAAEDAALAHEHRLEIERLCQESIAHLKEERMEMETLVNTYMMDRLVPFAQGVSAMDAAVLADDEDGYIAANAEIWALFGRESQYKNAEEFDDLMLSDETFKL